VAQLLVNFLEEATRNTSIDAWVNKPVKSVAKLDRHVKNAVFIIARMIQNYPFHKRYEFNKYRIDGKAEK